jgi:hypothetical protein
VIYGGLDFLVNFVCKERAASQDVQFLNCKIQNS